ncbi:hypothetical protein [Tindallia californiensis]|uniref:Uncharacterized protein n=1 Tax=Tindallia californiensis TaxID=159292 RepID=A0A1H3Q4J8_9FIRM|nr:hypothetical protein [Tindallia californiensis]SDZ08434.1 hypothetical protein SAMN05192546_10888 [Tindallia californiensis]
MAGFLGWINTISAILMGSIYPIKKKMGKDKTLVPLHRIIRKIHPSIGILMVVVGGYHGYLMLGGELEVTFWYTGVADTFRNGCRSYCRTSYGCFSKKMALAA